METVNTIIIDMPVRIKAYTVSNADGSYTIVINARLSVEQQRRSYEHERWHIENGDYEKQAGADLLEIYAHKLKETF